MRYMRGGLHRFCGTVSPYLVVMGMRLQQSSGNSDEVEVEVKARYGHIARRNSVYKARS